MRLRTGHGRRPLVLFHPVGGQVYLYRDLAGCLHEGQPVWGVQADPAEDGGGSLEDLAARYLAALRAWQPEGPYQLGGSSFGGVLAWEAAQQLREAGEEVRLLAMLDAPSPDRCPPEMEDAEILAYLLGQGRIDPEVVARLRGLPEDERLQDLSGAALPPGELRRFLRLWHANARALRGYTPRPYPGRVLFFRATEGDGFNRTDYHLGWPDLAPALEVHEVAGTHIGINLLPRVKAVAEVLAPRLE